MDSLQELSGLVLVPAVRLGDTGLENEHTISIEKIRWLCDQIISGISEKKSGISEKERETTTAEFCNFGTFRDSLCPNTSSTHST